MIDLRTLIPIDWERLAHKYPRVWDFVRKYWKHGVGIAVAVALIVGTGLFAGGRKSRNTINAVAPASGLTVQSPAFAGRRGGDAIPALYTADGQDYSPPLDFMNVPPEAVELALIVDDPDAGAEPFVHWVVYGMSPGIGGLYEGVPPPVEEAEPEPATPPGRSTASPRIKPPEPPPEAPPPLRQGVNSFGTLGYRGPAPPPGGGTHRYHFRLYALNAPLEAGQGLSKAELLALMQGKIVEEAELVGTYRR